MVNPDIYSNLPEYVILEDQKRGQVIEHICRQGIQPQYDLALGLLAELENIFNVDSLASNQFLDTITINLGLINYQDH